MTMANRYQEGAKSFVRLAAEQVECQAAKKAIGTEREDLEKRIKELSSKEAEIDRGIVGAEARFEALARTFTSNFPGSESPALTASPAKSDPIGTAQQAPRPTTPAPRSSLPEEYDDNITVSPRVREKAVLDNVTSSASPSNLDIINPRFPTVIYLDGDWTEVWCSECGANCKAKLKKFFRGAKGLYEHWSKVHKQQLDSPTFKACIKAAARRKVSVIDARRMRAGEAPQDVRVQLRMARNSPERITSAMETQSTANGQSPIPKPIVPTANMTPSAKKRRVSDQLSHSDSPKSTGNTAPKLTEYELFLKRQAEEQAEAAGGTLTTKKQRVSCGNPDYRIQGLDELERKGEM